MLIYFGCSSIVDRNDRMKRLADVVELVDTLS